MRLYGGLDLGGAKIQALVADDAGAVVGEAWRRTPQGGDPVSVVAALAEALAAAAEPAGIAPSALDGVGVGAPGIVDGMAGSKPGRLPARVDRCRLCRTPIRGFGSPTTGTSSEAPLQERSSASKAARPSPSLADGVKRARKRRKPPS
jgi:hypothetical protein